MASAEDAVVSERKGSVALISFNRPERLNAWSPDISAGLLQCLREAEEDEAVRGVVLTGVGRAFSAGADLKNPATHSGGVAGAAPGGPARSPDLRHGRDLRQADHRRRQRPRDRHRLPCPALLRLHPGRLRGRRSVSPR